MRSLVNDENVQRVNATAKIALLSPQEQRELAANTTNEDELEVLAESEDDVTKRVLLLENQHITSRVLERIAESDEEEFLEKVAGHPKADGNLLGKLAQDTRLSVRYIVAMRGDAPQEVLKKLAKDETLSVRALATRRLSLPLTKEEAIGDPGCSELNDVFQGFSKSVESFKETGESLCKRLVWDEYNPFNEFYRESRKALIELRDRIIRTCAASLRRKYVPNIDIDETTLKGLASFMTRVGGETHFDVYMIADVIQRLREQRTELSQEQLLTKVRGLLPYVRTDPSRPYSGWGPANKPEHILDGRKLKLRAYVKFSDFSDGVYFESDTDEEVAALDKISQVVLRGCDPGTVTTNVSRILERIRTRAQLLRKIQLNGSITSIRFYRNGRFDVEYADEESARKVAEAILPSDQGKPK